jgi:hypothetical protein
MQLCGPYKNEKDAINYSIRAKTEYKNNDEDTVYQSTIVKTEKILPDDLYLQPFITQRLG